MADKTGLPARRAALVLLNGVLGDRQPMNDQLAGTKSPFSALGPDDRARAQRLAVGTLRHLRKCDQMLGPLLRLPPRLPIHNILRLAVFELMADGAAAHGVVDAGVDLAREQDKSSKAPGLVNAVLRRVSEKGVEAWQAAPPSGLPKPWQKALRKAYGGKVLAALEQAFEAGAPTDLTVKDSARVEALAHDLEARLLPNQTIRLQTPGQITGLKGYDDGDWWVQDAAAAMAVPLMGNIAGQRVLDLCAAPGGKTMQLAAAGAQVTAVDISESRVGRITENLSRTGLKAEVITADALTYEAEPFDAVLLDAPCSASGTIRRHPELPYVKDPADLSDLLTLQAALLDRAYALTNPGGTLCYVTCSLLPEEGEAQLAAFLQRHGDVAVQDITEPVAALGLEPTWLTPDGGLRLRPDYWADAGGMDGFFIALLRRAS